MRGFLQALNHCCNNISMIQNLQEAKDLLMLLKEVIKVVLPLILFIAFR